MTYERFLASELPKLPPEECRFHVIPVPWEKTVSYGGGTALGPAAILAASQQLELWDGVGEPGLLGIHTTNPADCSGDEERLFISAGESVASALRQGAIPFLLGGEHTVSYAALRVIRDFYPDERIGIIHFDAHADLRDEYEGTPWSHASVMRRAVELGFDLFQIGIRACCKDEEEFRKSHGVQGLDGADISDISISQLALPEGFPEKVYVSFDVDGLDSAVFPATGTPVPGGLTWHQAIRALETTLCGRAVVGMDVVEFAPIPQLHFCDFAAALLCYRMMGISQGFVK